MNFLWFVSLVCLFAVVVQSQNDLFQAPKRGMGRRYCGRQLALMLSMVCHGNYNKNKKDLSYNELHGEDYDDQQEEEPIWPFLSRHSATAELRRDEPYGRRRRGVVDECCRKSCSFSDLQSYCARP